MIKNESAGRRIQVFCGLHKSEEKNLSTKDGLNFEG